MGLKDFFSKFKKKEEENNKSKSKSLGKKKDKLSDKDYPNRFVKFYHINQKRLNDERRSLYQQKRDAGICVRCGRKAEEGIIFCSYHRKIQKGYNKKAREK